MSLSSMFLLFQIWLPNSASEMHLPYRLSICGWEFKKAKLLSGWKEWQNLMYVEEGRYSITSLQMCYGVMGKPRPN